MARAGRATRNDVARLAGVSTAVVSYVLNNGPRPVAAATRERVLAAMRELNYRPNAAARALTLQKTNVLGLLVPDVSNPFFAEFGRTVHNQAFARGYALIVGDTGSDPERESSQIHSMLEREVDGLLIFGIQDVGLVELLTGSDVPLVSMDWQLVDQPVATVMVDDYRASRDAVAHLASHGHTRIGYIGGPEHLLVSRDRYRGWNDEMRARFPDLDLTGLAYSSLHTREGGYEVARRILAEGDRPTALFIGADIQAVGALRACHEAGVQVPQELAIISFDGTKESEYSNPPLSSVKLPIDEMAARALDKVLAVEGAGVDVHSVVQHTLLLRESCGCTSPAT
jgi:LacI family transcriptional regulator